MVNEEHPENAASPMNVTDDGISILFIEEHLENDSSPIDVTDDGISTFFNVEYPLNADCWIDFIDLGIIICVIIGTFWKSSFIISLFICDTLLGITKWTIISLRLSNKPKSSSNLILLVNTVDGISTLVNELHPKKAWYSIDTNVDGITIFVNDEHS